MKFLKKKNAKPGNDSLQMPNTRKKFNWKKLLKWIIIIVIIVVIVKVVLNRFGANNMNPGNVAAANETAKVETRDIQMVLSSSGTVEPLNTYEVSTLIEGEVITAEVEEGDQVKEGDVLYQITADDLDSKIDSSETAVTRANKNYSKAEDNYKDAVDKLNEALADYDEAALDYNNLNIESTASGTVKTLYVEVGDKVQEGGQIAEIYDNSSMLLEIPFNTSDVDSSLVGKSAEVEIIDSGEIIKGEVTKVSTIEEVLTGNRVIKTVTIRVKNPGGLTTTNTATAAIGKVYSSGEGTFKVLEETVITADKAGEIDTLKIEEGSKISDGDTVVVLSKETAEDQLESYKKAVESAEDSVDNAKDSMENAEDSIEDAETSLEDVIDSKTDYSITAPISGEVIRKDALAGDTIAAKSTLCVIYDLSALTFEMAVDELDVMSVEVGQEVDITADALEGVELSGTITNISLESTNSNGVTQYPVTVKINEVGDLLPGMNVTGEIIVEKVAGVLAVPSDALMRGDVVYVADVSVTEAVGNVPIGFKEVKVETGLTDGDYIEIVSGLTGTEEVYITRSTELSEAIYMQSGEFGMQAEPQGAGPQGAQQSTRPAGGNNGGNSQ